LLRAKRIRSERLSDAVQTKHEKYTGIRFKKKTAMPRKENDENMHIRYETLRNIVKESRNIYTHVHICALKESRNIYMHTNMCSAQIK
jgi:hypothetical protein